MYKLDNQWSIQMNIPWRYSSGYKWFGLIHLFKLHPWFFVHFSHSSWLFSLIHEAEHLSMIHIETSTMQFAHCSEVSVSLRLFKRHPFISELSEPLWTQALKRIIMPMSGWFWLILLISAREQGMFLVLLGPRKRIYAFVICNF